MQGDDGIRRGGLKQVERVRSPQELLGQMEKYDLSREEAIDRLQGVLIGSGQLLVRLTEAGRDHPDRVQQLLMNSALCDVLGLAIKVTLPPKPQDTDGSPDDGSAELAAAPVDYDLRVTWPGIQPHQERVEQFREMAAGLRPPAPAATAEGEPAVASAVNGDPLIETCFFRPGSAHRPGRVPESRRPGLLSLRLAVACGREQGRSESPPLKFTWAVGPSPAPP